MEMKLRRKSDMMKTKRKDWRLER